MKTKISAWLLAIFCSIAFFSCKKNNSTDVQPPPAPKKIYVLSEEETGNNGDYAVRYRVDGRVTTLIDGINYHGTAIDMKIQDTNVYVLAQRHTLPAGAFEYIVYKNGAAIQTFTANTNSFYAEAIALNGTELYVIGEEFVQATGGLKIKYWKNGSFTDISSSAAYSRAHRADIIGGSLYICGEEDTNNGRNAVLWKDGVKSILPGLTGSIYMEANDFAVAGNDVYVAGRSNLLPCYWKNGTVYPLPVQANEGSANSIVLSGNDVYICGGAYTSPSSPIQAVYWKNNSRIQLTSSTNDAEAYDIAVDGNDVYVAGYNSINGNDYPASFWKNGTETIFTGAGKDGEVKRVIAQ